MCNVELVYPQLFAKITSLSFVGLFDPILFFR